MAQEPVHYQADGGGEGRAAGERSVPRWWRGPDPDPVEVCRLYVQENRTETEIAVMMSVSRARVTAVLRDAGIPRRDSRKNCPVDPDTLRALVRAGATATAVAREHGVSHSTAARWFAEAGLLGADPKADTHQLVELYVQRRLTTREVAAELGISKDRAIRALTAAGIPRRPRSVRRPRGARVAVTDTALAEVYHRQDMTIAEAATHFGVSEEYVRRRVAEAGLTRRPGPFAPRSAWSPDVLQARAGKLYEKGMTMREVGARLGVSTSTVSAALHAAKVPVRPGGRTRPEAQGPPRTLIADLYADPDVIAALRRHQVEVPDEAEWHVTGPFQTYVPLPVPATLLRELYVDIGLSIHHIALLIGLGDMATRNRLIQAGVPFRPSRGRCPWNRRRYPGTEDDDRARNRASTASQ
jgi:transposase